MEGACCPRTRGCPGFCSGICAREAENFLRLSAVKMEVEDGRLIVVQGRNAQGKSSVLKAIMAALSQAKLIFAKSKALRDAVTEAGSRRSEAGGRKSESGNRQSERLGPPPSAPRSLTSDPGPPTSDPRPPTSYFRPTALPSAYSLQPKRLPGQARPLTPLRPYAIAPYVLSPHALPSAFSLNSFSLHSPFSSGSHPGRSAERLSHMY